MDNDKVNVGDSGAIETSLAPWLTVQYIVNAVDFYRSALGAVETYRMEEPEGVLQVCRLSIDGAEFWLSEGPGTGTAAEPVKASTVKFILTVADPDALYNQAIAAGASEIFPVNEEYGWRLGRLCDPFGYHWEIGRPL